jgi:hypothetical protein
LFFKLGNAYRMYHKSSMTTHRYELEKSILEKLDCLIHTVEGVKRDLAGVKHTQEAIQSDLKQIKFDQEGVKHTQEGSLHFIGIVALLVVSDGFKCYLIWKYPHS